MSLSAVRLCTACLLVAVMLPCSFLLCLLPCQLTPGIIGLPRQHPCSVTDFLSRIRGMRERKRHLAGMPRLRTGNFLAVGLQGCQSQRVLC